MAVVGSGPAGASAALSLAGAGMDVVIFEKAVVPRYKTCGGGIVARARRLLPTEMGDVFEQQCCAATMNLRPTEISITITRDEPIISTTMREDFDFKLLSSGPIEGRAPEMSLPGERHGPVPQPRPDRDRSRGLSWPGSSWPRMGQTAPSRNGPASDPADTSCRPWKRRSPSVRGSSDILPRPGTVRFRSDSQRIRLGVSQKGSSFGRDRRHPGKARESERTFQTLPAVLGAPGFSFAHPRLCDPIGSEGKVLCQEPHHAHRRRGRVGRPCDRERGSPSRS